MPEYSYTAVDLNNQRHKDTVEAKDSDDLRKILRSRNMVLIRYKVNKERYSSYRVRPNEVSEFCRQLASMLSSGITAVRGLEILKERDFKPGLVFVFSKLHKDVSRGATISEAMRMQPGTFPELLVNMFSSGEVSGQLERVAFKMAAHYEKEHKLNNKVKSAMTYPLFLAVTTVVVVMIIFAAVLPNFFGLFEDMQLPLVTRCIMYISSFVHDHWLFLIIGIFTVFAAIKYVYSLPKAALWLHKTRLKLPVLGKLFKIIYTARFSRTLSSLYSSGITMINALEISSATIGNKYIESQFSDVIKGVRNGEPLSEVLNKVDGFDKKIATTVLIGEESGRLDSLLEANAESFDYEAEMAAGRLVRLAEPVMIIILAVIVCAIMLAVMLPLMTIYSGIE